MNFLSVLAVVVSLTHYASAQSCAYVMKSGDTILNSVANGNPYVACAWINANGVDPCSLKAGQCLVAPSATTSTTCPSWCSSACCPSTYGYNGAYYPTYGSYGYNNGYNTGTGTTCGYGQYQVQYGNTFWNLGGQTNAGMCAWLNANPTVDPCNLKAGQCINQPAAGTSYTCYSSSYYYNNYNGWSYSCSNSIPSGTYGSYSGPYYNGYNGYNSGTGYNNGGYVAPSNSCNCGANQYCVQSGDTFCALALRTGLSACDWQGANNGISATGLQVGQCINNPVYTGYRAGYCSTRC